MNDINEPGQPDQAENSAKAKKSSELYDRFVELSRDAFELSKEKGSEAWEKSMELAREKLSETGEFSAEQGEVFKRYLRRDLEQTRFDVQSLGQEAKEILNPARLGAGALSTLEYNSGEMTAAGTLTCLSCGHKIQLYKTSEVPTCTECQGTRFRKGY
jgi:isocitrate dehydrogenase